MAGMPLIGFRETVRLGMAVDILFIMLYRPLVGLSEKSSDVEARTGRLLRLFEIALVFVRANHLARVIVNANHGIM